MKIEKSDWFISFFVVFAVLFFIVSAVWADNPHGSAGIVYERQDLTITTFTGQSAGVALGLAAGQHHYKATTQLQWSVGGGLVDDESAISFGLGLQSGEVFLSVNVSSDGSTSAFGLGASGVF